MLKYWSRIGCDFRPVERGLKVSGVLMVTYLLQLYYSRGAMVVALGSDHRKEYGNGGAYPLLTGDFQPASVAFGNVLYDRKPQSGPAN